VGTVDPPELMLLWSECYNQQRVNVAAGSGRTVIKQEFYAAAGGSIQRQQTVAGQSQHFGGTRYRQQTVAGQSQHLNRSSVQL